MSSELPKNLINFFRDFEVPQIVVINLTSEKSSCAVDVAQKFLCNSIVLALHSEKFKNIISAGQAEIFLEGFNNPVGIEAVRQCIEFMYGDQSAVHRASAGSIIQMYEFADNWDISDLKVACFNRIKEDFFSHPCKVFECYNLLSIFNEWQQVELWRELDKTTQENADSLIEYSLKCPALTHINGRICLGLIVNSKTAICGKFVMSMLESGDVNSKIFVLENLQLIPSATAFVDETELLRFESLFLPSERPLLTSIWRDFNEYHWKIAGKPECEAEQHATFLKNNPSKRHAEELNEFNDASVQCSQGEISSDGTNYDVSDGAVKNACLETVDAIDAIDGCKATKKNDKKRRNQGIIPTKKEENTVLCVKTKDAVDASHENKGSS